MYYQTEGKLSALNFKARRKMLKCYDFKHEKFAFLCPKGMFLEKWVK